MTNNLPEHEVIENDLFKQIVIFVTITWLSTPLIIIAFFKLFGADDLELTPGTFGDLFGSTNALFAGLAFAGLIWTIVLQQRTMRMQQSEIKIQRDMLIAQLDEQREARISMQEQANAQLKMNRSIDALTGATSLQAQISTEVAILQSMYEDFNANPLGQIDHSSIKEQKAKLRTLTQKLVNQNHRR